MKKPIQKCTTARKIKKPNLRPVIQLDQVTKIYTLHHEKPTFSEQFLHPAPQEQFTALKKFSLEVYQGQKVGVIGHNGAGKTTLLKIIAGVTTPTSGRVQTTGKVVSLINLEAGFHLDLTGEENIYLNGLLLGMSKQEIRQQLQSIIQFADIHQFIDAPFYTYSEGMKLRLGFAVAVHANPDILIIDEGLTVGDQDFQAKASQKIQEFFRAGKTILVVTHMLEFLSRNVERVVWIENGQIKKDGKTHSVLKQYADGFKLGRP